MTAEIKRKKLFSGNWDFIRSVPDLRFLPPEGPQEIAFAGRSNVGKSSLLNSLIGKKGLARTSNTPGRTQELNFFVPGGYSAQKDDLPPFALVDMPGYGYAQAPKAQIESWTKLIFAYLRGRSTLKRVYMLIDARHGLMKNDAHVLDMLDKAAVSYQIIFTKIDKIKPAALTILLKATEAVLSKRPAAYPQIIATSSETKQGIEDLQNAVIDLLKL